MSVLLTTWFSDFVCISAQATVSILVVLFLRFILSKTRVPKSMTYFLWCIPIIRLLVPLQVETEFSLIPKQVANPLNINTAFEHSEVVVETMTKANVEKYAQAVVETGVNNVLEVVLFTLSVVWMIGIAAFFLYGIVSAFQLKQNLLYSMHLRENIYLTDHIPSAFVLGVIKPVIYLPSDIEDEKKLYVILHEQMHIKRRDPAVKVFVFLICCVYWFQPAVWVLFHFLCKDMEYACDEAVIKEIGESDCKRYAEALLELSIYTRHMGPMPLTFAEESPKKRIQGIMSYQKPKKAFGIIVLFLMIFLAGGFLTIPKVAANDANKGSEEVVDDEMMTYKMNHGKSVVLKNKKTTGERKTTYFTFRIEDRVKASLQIQQGFREKNYENLKVDNVEKTRVSLQKYEEGLWVQVSDYVSWFSSMDTNAVYDEDDDIVYEETNTESSINGNGSVSFYLDEGEYRYVLETGFPKTEVMLILASYEKPATKKGKAVSMEQLEEGFYASGVFTVLDSEPQWFTFTLEKECFTELWVECFDSSNISDVTVYLYNEAGKRLWGYNLWQNYNQAETLCELEEGTYYIKVIPREVNAGTSFEMYTYFYDEVSVDLQ